MGDIVEIKSVAGTANGYLALPDGGQGPGVLLVGPHSLLQVTG
jgi:hypothetical protein